MGGHTAIWWIRRDLRLNDNQALRAALSGHDQIIPLFILDPTLLESRYSATRRVEFLMDGLRQLDAELRLRGAYLVVRKGDPLTELSAVVAETGAATVFAEEDFSPYARKRDAVIAAKLHLVLAPGLTVHPPGFVRKRNGEPYNIYTPFSKAWKRLPGPQASDLLPAPTRIKMPGDLRSESFPSTPPSELASTWPAGEVEAQRRLRQFAHQDLAPIFDYAQTRNLPGVEGTSLLSPYLRFGMVSARQAAVAAFRAVELAPTSAHRKGAETWLNEIIWREFYIAVLNYFPHVRTGSFQPRYDRIAWINDPALLRAWQEGCTGYPIVDAAMRQLKKSGWMHNRVRMIAASFLVKDLLIDWRLGEQWFMQHLIDGDPAANNGGWQWIAGTGIDAAPYFRVFNPVVQSKKFDPQGFYIRSQVPELANVPGKYVHEPWQMPPHLQQESHCLIGEDYPWPIIGHAEARERALAAYRAVSGDREAADC